MTLSEKIAQQAKPLLKQENIRTSDLVSFLEDIDISPLEIQAFSQSDPEHPYGRRVLLDHPRLEVMMATWTRDHPCNPHDHGDSRSAIRILTGRSHHQLYRIHNEQLQEVYAEKKRGNDILICGPRQIHAMGDDGDEQVLITLHAYSGSISNMLVYDQERTLLVKGSCGAWIPNDQEDVLKEHLGHLSRERLLGHKE